ncbi:hypothetical protein Q8A73_023245 [Channa argus]|nr:hypothetical protein Q8A73_023245 [Channa argus]
MLDPSSSEDTGGDSDPEVVQEAPKTPAASSAGKQGSSGSSTSSGSNSSRPGGQLRQPAAPGGAPGKGAKDGSATGEEEERKERERLQKEEEERKIKLQVYVFVLRCIAYPFNAKQPTDMARRQQKVSVHRTLELVHLLSGSEGPAIELHGEMCQFNSDSLSCRQFKTSHKYLNLFQVLTRRLLIRLTLGSPPITYYVEIVTSLRDSPVASTLSRSQMGDC